MVPEVLSQAEIDALLKALAAGEVDVTAIAREEVRKIKDYDFRRPDKFSKDQLRAIQMIFENFSRQLTTALSTQVRSVVQANVASVDQITYQEFTRSLLSPTAIYVLEVYPLEGNAILEINPALVFAIIDRLLGGKGEPLRKARELTDIERSVMERVVMRVLELLEESWTNIAELRFRIESMESNPSFVQIAPGTDMVLLVTMKIQVGQAEGMMNFCMPYFVIEPIVDKLSSRYWFAASIKRLPPETKEELRRKVERLKIPISVELGRARLMLSEVMDLQVGDVIKLDVRADEPALLRVGSRPKFRVAVGSSRGRYAVQVVEPISEEELEEADRR